MVNAGAEALRAKKWSLSEVVTRLGKLGVAVTKMTVSRWQRGIDSPSAEARAAMARKPFEIDPTLWDKSSGAPVEKTLGPSDPPPTLAPSAPDSSPASGVTVTTMRSAADLAEEQLAEIQVYRQQFKDSKLDMKARSLLADMEAKAIERYAKLTGQTAAPETVLVKSPAWTKLRDKILEVLMRHPDAARAVLKALEE
jgi:transcriptional regulator with XRE-family HTH domain